MNKIIEKRNAKFNSMTDKQKRIAIAKDVLASIAAKKYKITQGTYCSIDVKKPIEDDINLQELITNKDIKDCKVCAIGSIFMSRVALGNDYTVEQYDMYNNNIYIDDGDMLASLSGIFSERQLRLMEYVFEGKDVNFEFEYEDEQFHDIMTEFSNKYRTPTAKLKAIMENVISNDGEFIVTKEIKVEIK